MILMGMIIILFMCVGKQEEVLTSIYVDTKYQVYDLDENEIYDIFELDSEKIESVHIMKSILCISSEMIIMFKTNAEYMSYLKDSIDMYLDGEMSNYDGIEKENIRNRRTYEKDGYFIVVISKKADNIIEAIKVEIE